MATVLRTPDARFDDLAGHPFTPHYVEVTSPHGGTLRMHHVDEGPASASPVLLLHGEPTWSYLYRKVIPPLVAAGHRAVAPDHVGFGRSDKLTATTDYTYARHVGWLRELVQTLDLHDVTLVCQDWGGPIGLGVVAAEPERFARIVVANTILHTAEEGLAGRLTWPVHATGERTVEVSENLLDWMLYSQRADQLVASQIIGANVAGGLAPEVAAAYDAPFPDARYTAGLRHFPILIPVTRTDPGAAIARETWSALARFERPLLTAYSDGDPATRGWERVFQERVPGARDQPHRTIPGAGHFLQEERGEELGQVLADFIATTPVEAGSRR